MTTNEGKDERELKQILYENLELFDLIDKYVGRQEEKKKGWFWGGEGEDKEQFIQDNYGKILLLILKRRIEEEIKSEYTYYEYTTTKDNIIKYIKDYNQAYFSETKETKETTSLLPSKPQLDPNFDFSDNLYIGINNDLYTKINTVKDIIIKIVDHSPLHDGIKVERSTYNSAIHYKNIPIQGIKIEDTNLTTLDKATNFVLSKRQEIQIFLSELRDQLLLTYRKYVNGNYNDKRYLDILFENITQKHCKAKNAWCFFENEMVTNGWNYIVKYRRPPPTEDWKRYFTSKKIRVLALHPDNIQFNYNPDKSKEYNPDGTNNSPSQDKLYLLIILAANTLNYMVHTKFKQAPCEFYKSRLGIKTNKLINSPLDNSSDALHTKAKGSITSFSNALGNTQKRFIAFIMQKGKQLAETPSKLGNIIQNIFTQQEPIPEQYNHVNYFVLLRILKFCNSYKKFMFGPKSETSAFAPWQDTDIQTQKTWQEKTKRNIFEKYIFSKANVKYKSIDFENMKGNTLETGLDTNKVITSYNMCTKNNELSNIIQKKTNVTKKGITTQGNSEDIVEYTKATATARDPVKDTDISSLNCVDMLISEKVEKTIYNNLFNKFIKGKNIKFGIVKSDYQKDFNLLILKSKQYFKNDTKDGINYEPKENEKKEYNMKTQLLITIGYLYFIKNTYENCMFGISKYFKKGDKTATAANYVVTLLYYVLLFLIGTGTAGTGLLAVGYIYMTLDMVKTELLFRNIKYASMEIIDKEEDIVKDFNKTLSHDDKKILGIQEVQKNIMTDKDVNQTVGGTKKKRKNKTKRKNKYNRKTRK